MVQVFTTAVFCRFLSACSLSLNYLPGRNSKTPPPIGQVRLAPRSGHDDSRTADLDPQVGAAGDRPLRPITTASRQERRSYAFSRCPSRPSRLRPRQSGYAARRRSARSAACGSCARMRMSAIVAGSIITRFVPNSATWRQGSPAYRQTVAATCRGACGYTTGR